MLGFARKLLYSCISAFERLKDENYYFLGFETKLDHRQMFDFLLKVFERKSPGTESAFYKLVVEAADRHDLDLNMFKFRIAVLGKGFCGRISEEGQDYLLKKAYRRGISLYKARRLKRMLSICNSVMLNSTYGVVSEECAQNLPKGSIFITPDGKLKIKV